MSDPRKDPSQNPRDPGVGNDPLPNPAENPRDPSVNTPIKPKIDPDKTDNS